MQKRTRIVVEFETDTYDEAQWAYDWFYSEFHSVEGSNWAYNRNVISWTVNDKDSVEMEPYLGDSE